MINAEKNENFLDFSDVVDDNSVTSLIGLAIRPQVSSEPGFFFAQKHT